MMNPDFQRKPFLISNAPLEKASDLFEQAHPLTGAYLYYDHKTEIERSSVGSVEVNLIGYILDIRNGHLSTSHILSELARLYQSGTEEFYDYMEMLNGRYVLIISDENDTKTFSDATCMRPIFYYQNEFLGSHEALVEEVVRREKGIELNKEPYQMKGYLDYTSTEDIYKFNPSMFFSSVDAGFTRYYPRKPAKSLSTEAVFDWTKDYFLPQTEWLDQNFNKIYQSLTGGYDSKVSLAITKDMRNEIEYFTYMIDIKKAKRGLHRNIYDKDKKLVDRLVYNLNLPHRYYYFKDYPMPEEYEEKIAKNVSSEHSYILSYLTAKEFKKDAVHVKSTIYENAKLPYKFEHDFTTDYEILNQIATGWAPKALKNKKEVNQKMFNAFIERSKFQEIEPYGYNLPMMLYWETRMANWHSNITQETDNTVETFVFVNNRYMLDQFMHLDTISKRDKEYFEKLIEHFWPILNYFIPNSMLTLADYKNAMNTFRLYEKSIVISKPMNVDVSAKQEHYSIQPSDSAKLQDDEISFVVMNQGNQDVDIEIRSFYQHPNKNIFIKINDKSHSINDFYDGKEIEVKAGEKVGLSYRYTKNFDRDSWYKAGKLEIR